MNTSHRNNSLNVIFTFILFFFSANVVIAEKSENDEKLQLNYLKLDSFFSYVKDESFNEKKVVEGFYDDKFKMNESGRPLVFKNTVDNIWIKIEIDSSQQLLKYDYYLKIVSKTVQKLDLFYLNESNELQHYLSGVGYEINKKQLHTYSTTFYVEGVSKQYKNLYLKLNPRGLGQVISAKACNKEFYSGEIENENFSLGIKYGVFLFVFLLNIFYFLTTKNRVFIYYSIYILLSTLLTSVLDDVISLIFQIPVAVNLFIFIIPLFFAYLPLMSFKFLELDKKGNEFLYYSIFGVGGLNLIMAIDGMLIDSHKVYILKYGTFLFFLSFIILVTCAVKGIIKNKFIGIGFFIGFSILIIGLLIGTLQTYGYIDISFGRELIGLSIAAEITILSLTLAIRFSKIERISESRKIELQQLEVANKEMQAKVFSSQMNPHFLFNSLNSIERMYVEGKTNLASDYLSDFSSLLRKTLNNTSKEFVTLREDLDMLELYLDLEKLRTDNQIDYQINIDNSINPFNVKIPPFIIQPFVENAIWHGILPTKLVGKIIIFLSLENDKLLTCTVQDNGVGYFTSKKNKNITHESKGIQIAGKRLNTKDAIKIEELENGGTLITLKIPIS